MSKKDIIAYYDQICDQYMDMQNELKDFAKECEQGLLPPERLDQFKQMMEPIMINYQRISAYMVLLNRRGKVARARNLPKEMLDEIQEGRDALGNLHKFVEGIKCQ